MPGRTPRSRGIAIGLITAIFALGVAELVAAMIDGLSSPIIAVGGAAIDATPEWLKSFAIRTFGARDKTALLTGMVVVVALLAMAMGIVAVRRPRIGYLSLAVFGAVGSIAAITRPTSSPWAFVPSVVGALAGMGALNRLLLASGTTSAPQDAREPGSVEDPGLYDRRRFLLTATAVSGLALALGSTGRFLTGRQAGAVETARADLIIPTPRDAAPLAPANAALDVPGVTPFITSNQDFYRVDTSLLVPHVDPDTWRLTVHGMVDHDMELTLADLLDRPLIERDITITCVSNEVGGTYAGNARWVGVPLKDLLEEAGVHADADQIVSRSVDGFTVGTPTAIAMDGRDAMLAVSMNGEALPFVHGFPVRMIVPGLFGYVSATKWLTDIELSTFDTFDPYWVQRGWSAQAPIKTMARIDTPKPLASLSPGSGTIAGVAWAQHRGIGRVEVRVDGGAWQTAHLASTDSIDTWRLWSLPWDAPSGRHTLEVRATDADGQTQPSERVAPFPDGATGWHSVVVTVR